MRSDSTLARWLTQVRRLLGSSASFAGNTQARRERAVRRLRAQETAADPWLAEERILLSAPAVVLSVASATYTENAQPVTLDPMVTASDPDADLITGAQIKIVDFESSQDQLSFTPQFGINGSYNNMTGILTLNGISTASRYATVLSSVKYVNLTDAPSDLTRTIEFRLTDTEPATSAPATLTLNLISVADTPADVNTAIDEDTFGLVSLAPNPIDGNTVTHFQITGITNGTLFLNNETTVVNNNDFVTVAQASSLKFKGDPNYFGPAGFKFQASTTGSNTGLGGGLANANITILSVNDNPTITVPGPQTTNEGTVLPINGIVINDVDVGSNLLTVSFQATGPTASYTLSNTSGITFLNGTTNGGSLPLEIQGTLADLQGALATLQVQPHDNGTLSLTIIITDELNGSAQATIPITVNNVAPALVLNPVTAINENGIATLSGTIMDPGSADTFTLVVDWGDGTAPVTFTYAAGTTAFSVTHQYLDDNPSGTASDTYTIQATLTDDDTGSDMKSTTVMVNNVAPVLTLNAVTAILENGVATLSGTIVDPGTADTFTLEVDWGDGTAPVTYTLAAGTTAFSVTHQYLDDNPTVTSSDTYTIQATLTDDDTGSDMKSTTVMVNNVAPVLTLNAVTAIVENGVATLSGIYMDTGTLDTHTLSIDWGDGSAVQTVIVTGGTFSVTHQYLDDNPSGTASDTYTIQATLIDDDMGSDTQSTTVMVSNVAPVLTLNALTAINENGIATLSGTIVDPGTADTFTLVVDWGDGTAPVTYTLAAGTTTFSVTHQYLDDNPTATASDSYTIKATLTDDDTGSDMKSTTVTVNNVAPTLVLNPVTAINENGSATLSGTITDPGTADTFTLEVDWGDGTAPVTYTLAAGATTFSVTHQYLDDNPSGTASDTYTIKATLTDDDTGSDMKSTTVTVNNVNPSLTLVLTQPASGTIFEGDTVTFTGTATDPANTTTVNDPLIFSWTATKDGSFYASGAGNIATFQVVDNGIYIVTMTVKDDDLGSDTKSYTINVANVAPTPTVTGATTGFEGTAINLTATSTDPANMPTTPTDNDLVFYSWQVLRDGAVYTTGAGTNFTLTPNNEGTYQVFLTASDEDGGSRTTLHTITVANVAPTAAINATDINGQFYTYVDIAVDDPGNDGISVLIVWGDINPADFLNDPFLVGETATTRTFPTVSHRYLTAPNPQDPLAPVTITFFINDGTTTVIQQVTVEVTEQGIPAGGVYITPEPEQIVLPPAQVSVLPPEIITQPPQLQVRNEEIVSREDQRTDQDARLVLHVVGPTGIEGPAVTLPDGLLQNLRGLFAKLPDGHYRVYLVQGESRRLVIEAFVRQGRAIDPAEADQGTQERPPQVQPAAQQEHDRVMQAEPVGQAVPDLELAAVRAVAASASGDLDANASLPAPTAAASLPVRQGQPDLPTADSDSQTSENADQAGVLSLAAAGVVAGTSWRRSARRQRTAASTVGAKNGTTGPDSGEKIEKSWSRLARRVRQWKPR